MKKNQDNRLLNVAEMYEADRLAIKMGISGPELMENAGAAITREILARYTPNHVLILCGPGNNGGDGFVVGRQLHQHGIPVKILLLGDVNNLKGDAALNAKRWQTIGDIFPLNPDEVSDSDLIVDALFGAGLTRDIEGCVSHVLEHIEKKDIPIVAVDVPSGVDGDSGEIKGRALQADLTITFAQGKTGPHLYPGKALCGELIFADIGIPSRVIDQIGPQTSLNRPQKLYQKPRDDGHKYHRGHALIIGGDQMTGATRLASLCTRRTGAGLTTISCSPPVYDLYRQCEPGHIVTTTRPQDLWADHRKNVVLCGPGLGVNKDKQSLITDLIRSEKAVVLDADALTMMADIQDLKRQADTLITPHEGEFSRLFPDLTGSKLERARKAAEITGYTVLLKGADTVICAPDGKTVINDNGTPWLATAGSGDCLAGICTGLMAQGYNSFDSACLGAWIHGACASQFGPGLIAEDIAATIPSVLKSLICNHFRC